MQLSNKAKRHIETWATGYFNGRPVNRIVYKCGIDVIADHWIDEPFTLPVFKTIYNPTFHGESLTHIELWHGNEFLIRVPISGMLRCPVGVDRQIIFSVDFPRLDPPTPIERLSPRKVDVEECPDCGAPLGTCDNCDW